ncbi:MshP protein [Photobacterium leiognathi]|uniref:MshP protein n=1 Tax=Photobacterium leiognathi TaxID=553611 RepID=UPI00273892D0|nr:MshP protein [Photobacterium leiognathi]
MSYSSYNKQRGSGLMIVLFVIVVMGLMAMVMTKIGTSSQTMTTKEVLGTRAWFTAHSANEVVLTKLFPLGKPLASDSTACKNYSAEEITSEMPRFQTGCKVDQIQCTMKQIKISGKPSVTEYRLESTATCGSNDVAMTRTQEVWAKGVE